MSLRTEEFRPDTCRCVLELQYDPDLPLDQIETSIVATRVIRRGPEHPTQAANDIWEENKLKNGVRDIIATFSRGASSEVTLAIRTNVLTMTVPLSVRESAYLATVSNAESQKAAGIEAMNRALNKDFRIGQDFSYTFNAGRMLQVTITGFTPAEKVTLQAQIDVEYGAGRVQIV